MLERHIARLASLRELTLKGCDLQGDALKYLRPLRELRSLWINCEGIDNSSVPYLREFPELRELNLWETGITAASLHDLLKLRGLRRLTVPFPLSRTRELERKLKREMPELLWVSTLTEVIILREEDPLGTE